MLRSELTQSLLLTEWRLRTRRFRGSPLSLLITPSLLFLTFAVANGLTLFLVWTQEKAFSKNPGGITEILVVTAVILTAASGVRNAYSWMSLADDDLRSMAPTSHLRLAFVHYVACLLEIIAFPLFVLSPFINAAAVGVSALYLYVYGLIFVSAILMTSSLIFGVALARKYFSRSALNTLGRIAIVIAISLHFLRVFLSDLASKKGYGVSALSTHVGDKVGSHDNLYPALALIIGTGLATLSAIIAIRTYRPESLPRHQARRQVHVPPPKINKQALNNTSRLWIDSLPTQILFKEWRLILRGPKLFPLAARVILVLGSLVALAASSTPALSGGYLILLVIGAGAIVANDVSWLAVAGEQVPQLLQASPIPVARLWAYKSFASMAPVVLVLEIVVVAISIRTQTTSVGPYLMVIVIVGWTTGLNATAVLLPRFAKTNATTRNQRHQPLLLLLVHGISLIAWLTCGAVILL